MQGINIPAVYSTSDNKFINLHNICYGYQSGKECYISFPDKSILVLDINTYNHIVDILSNVYTLLELDSYILFKPHLINYIYVTDVDITIYLVDENILVVDINKEPYIIEYMHQHTLITQHFS